MPDPLQSAIDAFAQSLRISPGTQTGNDVFPTRFTFSLRDAGGQTPSLGLTGTVRRQVPGEVDLRWVAKDVRFQTAEVGAAPQDQAIHGGQPITDLLQALARTVTHESTPDAQTVGVPGVVGLLRGTLPFPMEVEESVEAGLAVDLRLRVLDETGRPLADVQLQVGTAPPVPLGDVRLDAASLGQDLTLLFPVLLVEITRDTGLAPLVRRTLQGSVRVSSASPPLQSPWVDLPPVPLVVPAISVPTMLFLHTEANFGGDLGVLVPSNSPLDPTNAQAALDALNAALSQLPSTSGFGTILGLLTGLRVSQPPDHAFLFGVTDEAAHLDHHAWHQGWYFNIGRWAINDTISSMRLIGLPGRRAEFFNHPGFDPREGRMDVTVGPELVVSIASLANARPASEPPGRVAVPTAPNGWIFLHRITTFNNEISSFRFRWP